MSCSHEMAALVFVSGMTSCRSRTFKQPLQSVEIQCDLPDDSVIVLGETRLVA